MLVGALRKMNLIVVAPGSILTEPWVGLPRKSVTSRVFRPSQRSHPRLPEQARADNAWRCSVVAWLGCICAIALVTACTASAFAQRQMEPLDRGVVAIRQPDGGVFVSWRMLGTDPDERRL